MVENEPKSTDFADKPLTPATKSLIESYIDEQIEYCVRPLKNMVKSALNAQEIHQSSIDISFKEINMRINALSGHVAKKKKAEDPVFYDLESALKYRDELQTKNASNSGKSQRSPQTTVR